MYFHFWENYRKLHIFDKRFYENCDTRLAKSTKSVKVNMSKVVSAAIAMPTSEN